MSVEIKKGSKSNTADLRINALANEVFTVQKDVDAVREVAQRADGDVVMTMLGMMELYAQNLTLQTENEQLQERIEQLKAKNEQLDGDVLITMLAIVELRAELASKGGE